MVSIFLRKHYLYTGIGEIMQTKLERIAEISRNNKREVFTSVYHLLNKELMMQCHKEMDGKKAVGIDGVSKVQYEENLDKNLENLVLRLKNKSFKPMPSKRKYIPKGDGNKRPLGIAVYEDKIVQLALKKIVEAVFEPKFLNCMYGFRPSKGCHDALKSLNRTIERGKVNYVLDADIKGFFNNVNHEWVIKFVEVHIKDPNINRLILKYLKAGIMEDGIFEPTDEGTAQGSNLSPVLSNIYMHYALTLWFYKVIIPQFKGECYITVYADDYVCCFQHKWEAEKFYEMLKERLEKFNLELEPSKSRLIGFGRFAESDRKGRGEGKPETFDFLGFTHYCSKSRNGKFRVKRRTSRKKFKAKIGDFKEWIKANRTLKLKILIDKINAKLRGHYRYYGITDNGRMIMQYHYKIKMLLYLWLNRRSQRKSYTLGRFDTLMKYVPLEKPKIYVNIFDI